MLAAHRLVSFVTISNNMKDPSSHLGGLIFGLLWELDWAHSDDERALPPLPPLPPQTDSEIKIIYMNSFLSTAWPVSDWVSVGLLVTGMHFAAPPPAQSYTLTSPLRLIRCQRPRSPPSLSPHFLLQIRAWSLSVGAPDSLFEAARW